MRLRPQRSRAATRVVVATGVRGGVGRSLLAANLAMRIAPRMRVCVVDATGHGAVSWWLRCSPRPWTEFEGLVDELTADHLAVMAEESMAGVRVIGGTSVAPTTALLGATIRAATGVADLVIVDAPLRNDARARAAAGLADRVFVLAYDDPWSQLMLDADPPGDEEWLVASQMKSASLDGRRAFRALPRDESAVASAVASRGAAKGALGKAYDELADLLVIDAT
jgi:cellulose biosynthesis protein BcsQ